MGLSIIDKNGKELIGISAEREAPGSLSQILFGGKSNGKKPLGNIEIGA